MTADAAELNSTAVPAQHPTATGGRKEVKRKQLQTSFENELTATKKRFFTGNGGNFFEVWTRFADKFITGDDRIGFYNKIIEVGNYLVANGDFYGASWQCFQCALEFMHGYTTHKHHDREADHVASKQAICSIKSIQTTEQLRKAFFIQEFPDKTVALPDQKQTQGSRRRRAAAGDGTLVTTPADGPAQTAKKQAARLTELKLNAIQGFIDAEIEVLHANDARLRFAASTDEALALLKLLRCLMDLLNTAAVQQQMKDQHQQQSSSLVRRYFVYFHNASILTFKVCRMLMSAGHAKEVSCICTFEHRSFSV